MSRVDELEAALGPTTDGFESLIGAVVVLAGLVRQLVVTAPTLHAAGTLARVDKLVALLDQALTKGAPIFASAVYTFDAALTPPPAGPPGKGRVQMNTADQTQATTLWLRYDTAAGLDVRNLLAMLRAEMQVVVQDVSDSTKTQRYATTGDVVRQAEYGEIPVRWVSGENALTTNAAVNVIVSS